MLSCFLGVFEGFFGVFGWNFWGVDEKYDLDIFGVVF